ncbi:MAG TPA: SpoIIE family protein phosphatase [Baekduia sp.]|uniref:PP2C family protein-serine/threonine phosphatase n=1 Tax=Baekduia sp. TaxID=2600305 RepID=UPI002B68E3C8|nr:SpoIIE family protein phosphatase [Baekduia sp.]HMJ34230.1 SpoIIE family protein phosphatase [Baekduia sp.]
MAQDVNAVGRRRRRRSDVALNRTKLLEAARHLLSEDPDVSMAAIAKAAGLGRPTAYRHFGTREELVEAVRRQERDDAEANELEFVRPAGELAHRAPTPLSVTDVLNKVPPFQLGDQIVAEAQRLAGVTAAAIYLCDLDGTTLQRMAGGGGFPASLPAPLAVGPEIPREGVAVLRASIQAVLPGVAVAPMYLRGRAIGVLVAMGAADDALRDLAAEAAAAIALADDYTDAIGGVRRARPTSPAAEIQQNLLPPRILRIAGALIAGNVLPGYDIGGDWFDYAENRDCAWIGIADTEGRGPRAAGLGAVILGAFRAARHRSTDPAVVVRAMHEVLREVSDATSQAHATIATWSGPTSTIRWITCGEHAPVLITADGTLELLGDGMLPRLGRRGLTTSPKVQERRLEDGDRLLLLSDAIIDRPMLGGGTLGLDGVREAVAKAPLASAAGTLRAIEDAVREAVDDPLADDATLVVLVPNPAVSEAENEG